MSALPRRTAIPFARSERSTVGLEWELALVDADSGDLRQVAQTVLDAVRPAEEIDPGYAAALREAVTAGVEVLAYGVSLTCEEIRVERRLPVQLGR